YSGHSSIDVTATGTVQKCATVHWTSKVNVTPLVRQRADGKSILVVPSTQETQHDNPAGAVVCGLLDIVGQIFGSLIHPLGSATATVSTHGECAFPMTADPLEFNVSTNDHFYATTVDTDQFFYVAGRSTFMDQIVGQRPAVPSCP